MGSVAVVGMALVLASPLQAAEPRYQLVYQPHDAPDCADEATLRGSVAAELGYDPFDDAAATTIVVTIRPAHGRMRGRIEMRLADGGRIGARELAAPSCVELMPALELALAVAIDPLRAGAQVPPSPSAGAPSPSPSPSPSPLPLPSAPPRPPTRAARFWASLRLRVAVGAQLSVDAAPGPSFGLMARAGVGARRWSLALELRGDLPGSATVDGGQVITSLMDASLVPCAHHRGISLCAIGSLGRQNVGGSGYLVAHSSWAPWAALGGRIELELPVSRLLAVLLRVDVVAPLTRTVLVIGGAPGTVVYESAAICNTFGVALSTR